jgi:hypothetical protein
MNSPYQIGQLRSKTYQCEAAGHPSFNLLPLYILPYEPSIRPRSEEAQIL